MNAARRLWSKAAGRSVRLFSTARGRCTCITILSRVRVLQLQSYSDSKHPFSSSIGGRPLTTINAKVKQLREEGSIGLGKDEEPVAAVSVTGPRQRSYIRKDNLKWHKSPWKVKQLRFSRHILNLVKKGKMEEAQKVFEQMKERKVQPDVAIFNVLIAGYGRRGDAHISFRLFNEMKKRSLLPTDHTYSSLFAACAEVGPNASTILDRVQSEIERRSFLLNNISTNALITALASCGHHDDALGVYSDMLNRNMNPDLHTFGGLLLAAASDKVGGFEVAQRVWSDMVASGMNPDLHCFNLLLQCVRDSGISPTLINTVGNKRSLTLSLNLTDENLDRRQRNSANVELYVSGVVGLSLAQGSRLKVHLGHSERRRKGRSLRWLEEEDVEMLFDLFNELRVRPEIRTFHLLAHLCPDPSLLIKEMTRRRVKPDSKFMVAAIKTQAQLGNLTGAKLLLDYSNKADLPLDQAGYQAVATSCLAENDGLQLIDDMLSRNILPNEYVFGTLLGNAASGRSYEYLTALLKKMLHLEVAPNDTILEILETAANHKPTGVRQMKRWSGFKGYYSIWRRLMAPND